MNQYNFKIASPSSKSLINLIAMHGKSLVGIELGIFQAESFCTILQTCENVEKLYGVDRWEPYYDYIKDEEDGMLVDEKISEINKFISYHNLKFSGCQSRGQFLEMSTKEASSLFENNFFDFIFLDAYLSYEQAKSELYDWYPKLKSGGIFCGHDWSYDNVQQAVNEFRYENNINSYMCNYDDCWVWIKDQ